MIRSVQANRPGFREARFTSGVNMILADRSRTAGDKDTTNALVMLLANPRSSRSSTFAWVAIRLPTRGFAWPPYRDGHSHWN